MGYGDYYRGPSGTIIGIHSPFPTKNQSVINRASRLQAPISSITLPGLVLQVLLLTHKEMLALERDLELFFVA